MIRKPKDYPFYIGTQAHTFKYANALRISSTDSEKILWQKLKAKKICKLNTHKT